MNYRRIITWYDFIIPSSRMLNFELLNLPSMQIGTKELLKNVKCSNYYSIYCRKKSYLYFCHTKGAQKPQFYVMWLCLFGKRLIFGAKRFSWPQRLHLWSICYKIAIKKIECCKPYSKCDSALRSLSRPASWPFFAEI